MEAGIANSRLSQSASRGGEPITNPTGADTSIVNVVLSRWHSMHFPFEIDGLGARDKALVLVTARPTPTVTSRVTVTVNVTAAPAVTRLPGRRRRRRRPWLPRHGLALTESGRPFRPPGRVWSTVTP